MEQTYWAIIYNVIPPAHYLIPHSTEWRLSNDAKNLPNRPESIPSSPNILRLSNSPHGAFSIAMVVPRDFRTTINKIIQEVCQAIVLEFKDKLIPCLTTEEELRSIVEEYQRRWNVPHACEAPDEKHVALKCPNSGSMYHRSEWHLNWT